jgi:hypothetical protein
MPETMFGRKSSGAGFQAGLSEGQSGGTQKLLSNVVRRAAGFSGLGPNFSGLGPNNSARKKHQHKKVITFASILHFR